MTEVLKSSSLWCRSSEPSCPSGECSRCTSVGGSDAAPPLPEFLATVVGADGDLDQAEPVVRQGPYHGLVQFPDRRGAKAEPLAFASIEHLHEPRIVPV